MLGCVLKSHFSHDLQIVGNIWDIVSNQLNKIYNIGLVVFGYFTAYCTFKSIQNSCMALEKSFWCI